MLKLRHRNFYFWLTRLSLPPRNYASCTPDYSSIGFVSFTLVVFYYRRISLRFDFACRVQSPWIVTMERRRGKVSAEADGKWTKLMNFCCSRVLFFLYRTRTNGDPREISVYTSNLPTPRRLRTRTPASFVRHNVTTLQRFSRRETLPSLLYLTYISLTSLAHATPRVATAAAPPIPRVFRARVSRFSRVH